MPTTAQALDTYKRSIANEHEGEHLPWVNEVRKCLQNGTEPQQHIWMPYVYEVLNILKQEKEGRVSFADEKDKP